MTEPQETNLITIGRAVEVLSRDYPDVSVSSLRFLEREGLLSPQRKPGGHRLYGPKDIERARIIKQWQANRLSLKEIRGRLHSALQYSQIPVIVDEMTIMLLAEDIDGACDLLEKSYESGTPLIILCDDVLTPVLHNLGDEDGNHLIPVDVQLELDQRLSRFLSRAAVPPVNQLGRPVVLAACPPWERHDMPLQMHTALLIERGMSMHYIGTQVESEFVRDANIRLQPDIILISITVRPDDEQAMAWFRTLIDSMSPHQKLFLGGMSASWVQPLEAQNVKVVGMESYTKTTARLLRIAVSDSEPGESNHQSS